MKSWHGFSALVVVGTIVLAGCGGGGVLAPTAPEYRMVTVASSGTVAMYSVSSAGSMSQIGTTSTGYQFVSVEAMTDRLYASASNTDGIYSIGFSNDAPFSNSVVATASDSGSLLFKHPTKSALYAVVPAQNTVDQWTINVDGSLTAMVPGSVGTDMSPRDMVFHPSGNYAYVVNRGSEVVRVYSIDSNGALSLIPGAAFSTNSHPVKLIMTDDGAHLYAMSEDNDISQFSIGGNGLLTPLAPQKTVYSMGNFRAAMTANNVLSFYRESDEGIETFGRSGNGQLTNLGAANFATNAITDVYRLPGQNLLMLLAKGSGSSTTISMGSNGIGTLQSEAVLPVNTVDVAFWQMP